MNLSQILAWLSGPGVGVAISYILDQWSVWRNWEPADALGFNPKAIIITIGSLLLGMLAYAVATTVPQATIDQLDPYVKAAFPILTLIIPQIWHAVINKRLTSTTVIATTDSGGSVSATAVSGSVVSGNAFASNSTAVEGGSNSPGQGS